MKKYFVVIFCFILYSNNYAEESQKNIVIDKNFQYGKEVCLDISTSIQSVYSQVNISILFPKIKNMINFGIKASYSVCFDVERTFIPYGFTPMLISGSILMNIGSPVLYKIFRAYGGMEIILGSIIIPNPLHIGDNLIYGGTLYGGLEFYTCKILSIYIEGGFGGLLHSILNNPDEYNQKIMGLSGAHIVFGLRVYITNKRLNSYDATADF